MGFSNIKYFTMRLKTKDSIDKAVGRVLLSARITKQSRSDIISHAMSFVPLYKFLEQVTYNLHRFSHLKTT